MASPPSSVPTSTPSLSAEWTQHPTSSRSGWPRTPSIAARPTLPVAHWITRRVMARHRTTSGPGVRPDVAGWSVGHLPQPPGPGHALQVVLAPVLEPEARPGHQVAHRLGDPDL